MRPARSTAEVHPIEGEGGEKLSTRVTAEQDAMQDTQSIVMMYINACITSEATNSCSSSIRKSLRAASSHASLGVRVSEVANKDKASICWQKCVKQFHWHVRAMLLEQEPTTTINWGVLEKNRKRELLTILDPGLQDLSDCLDDITALRLLFSNYSNCL